MKVRRKKIPYWLVKKLATTKNAFQIIIDNDYETIPNLPIIFAANHTNCYDFPITATAINKPVYVLVGYQRLGLIDKFFFSLNGSIYADRLDRNDTSAVKDKIICFLNNGHSICWYPEGTWNLTDNLLMLPMKWGVVDVAKQAGAQIIPVALVYDREDMTCTVRFGLPIYGNELKNIIIAYEPVWENEINILIAKEKIQEMHEFIRKEIKEKLGEEISNKIRIIFGGKVDENNCKELIQLKDVDGFLVGEPSIKSSFNDIIYSAKLKK